MSERTDGLTWSWSLQDTAGGLSQYLPLTLLPLNAASCRLLELAIAMLVSF